MFNNHWSHSVHHDGSPSYVVCNDYTLGASVTLRLRVDIDAPIEHIFVRSSPDGEQRMTPMQVKTTHGVYRVWETKIQLHMPRTNYRFFLITAEGNWWYTSAGMIRYTPTDTTDFKILAQYDAPSWVQETVFYQIFPDRFADGDPASNVCSNEYQCHGLPVVARTWGEIPCYRGEAGNTEFFGGDLQGIVQRLGYVEDLGVTALYLNPIFTAPSNHKYDVTDYRHVDAHLGGDAALIALRRALDKRGMKLVLDIVPNHCGANHPWFLDAQADANALSADFFTFGQDRIGYESWLGIASLPKLNYRSTRLREEMYAGKDAIMRYWLRPPFRIDGWRIDVANMLARQGESQLGHKIGRAMRRAVKSETPHAYLLGEHFFDGTSHLQGDELDAAMNYRGFSFPLLQWLVGFDAPLGRVGHYFLPTEALAAQWHVFLSAIPWQIATQQFNTLGSHDTPRIQTILGGDEILLRLAVTLLFTYPGVPSIYYGDEIGLAGEHDPDCRRCMIWDVQQWNSDRRTFYQKLIRMRRTSPALRRGGFQLLYAAGETLAFLREAAEERLLVVARRASDTLMALPVRHAGFQDGTRLREVFTGAETVITGGMLPLHNLAPVGYQMWRQATVAV